MSSEQAEKKTSLVAELKKENLEKTTSNKDLKTENQKDIKDKNNFFYNAKNFIR